MPGRRRNQITRNDAIAVAAVSIAAGVAAALAGCSPTGAAVPDAIITTLASAVVVWLGASSPWWALFLAGGVAAIAATTGPIVLVVLAWLAVIGAAVIGYFKLNQPVARSVIAAVVVQVVLRLEWDPFFFASGIVAAVAMGLIAISGFTRRQGFVRKRVLWVTVGLVGFAGLATVAFGASAAQVRGEASSGYRAMLLALEHLENGDLPEANQALDEAAVDLGTASDALEGVLSQPARFVPGVAQNRNITANLFARAAAAAEATGKTLDVVDLDQLRVVDGVVDVGALEALEQPLIELEAAVLELRDVLYDAQSEWLVGPLASRLDNARVRADQAATQAVASRAAAQLGPELLGAEGDRRYLVAFTNPAESRGQSGLMGNWSELTLSNGRIELARSGRTAELERGIDDNSPIHLDMPQEYFDRYSRFGSGTATEPVHRKYWVNSFVTPHAANVGTALAQLYEVTTGRRLDGVIIMTPKAIAALLNVTGPIEIESVGVTLTDSNAEQFLVLDQYEFAENEREDLLAEVTTRTVDALLTSTLPAPQVIGAALGPVATEGHLTAWAVDAAEQELIELVGMDASMPVLGPAPGSDALAIVSNNGSGNKIDSFLERTIVYRPRYDESSGAVVAELEVTLTNTAPASGLNDYVIGNGVDLPIGTNRTMVELWSALDIDAVTVDDVATVPYVQPELGWNVAQLFVELDPGESAIITVQLSGTVASGGYELIYRPQPLPRTDAVEIDASLNGGGTVFTYSGEILRRSVLSETGIEAWRPPGHPALQD